MTAPLTPGEIVAGEYLIDTVLSDDGVGYSYSGHHQNSQRIVTIVEVCRDRCDAASGEYDEYGRRFARSYVATRQMAHPNVVSALALVRGEVRSHLVLDVALGCTLREVLLSRRALSPEQVIRLGLELCSAVEAIYARGIVHRDIKPTNVLIDGGGRVRLNGFGIAQLADDALLTQSGMGHPGTPAYKSPEQAGTTGYLDERSDLYSVSLLLYEALTGHPFVRDRTPPHLQNRGIPNTLSAVVMRGLEHDPADRYQTCSEMRADLERVDRQSTWGQLRIAVRQVSTRRLTACAAVAVMLVLIVASWRLGGIVAQSRTALPAEMAESALQTPTCTGGAPGAIPTESRAAMTLVETHSGTDVYEPDLTDPVRVSPGEMQARVFNPDGDVDRAVLHVKAGNTYVVSTEALSVGVDTSLEVLVGGKNLSNDDAGPGTLASSLVFSAEDDGVAVITITNAGEYGPEQSYTLSVDLVQPTQTARPTAAATMTPQPSRTPRPTLTIGPTATRPPTATRTPTVTRTPTRTRTPTMTRTPTVSPTPSVTRTASPTPTASATPTPNRTPLPVKTPGPPTV